MSRLRSRLAIEIAIGAYVLTVMMGLAVSASALWHQSATATMSISAALEWPGPAIRQFSCANPEASSKQVNLSYVLAETPSMLSLSVKKLDGTYGPGHAVTVIGATGTITLTTSSPIIVENRSMEYLPVRLTATYSNNSDASAEIRLRLDSNSNSGRIYCA